MASYTLNWTAAIDTVDGYNVYWGTSSGQESTRLNSTLITGTSLVISSVPPGPNYYIVKSSIMGVESIASNEFFVSGVSPIAATIAGTSAVTGKLRGVGAISGSIFGTSSVTATLSSAGSLAAVIVGKATVSVSVVEFGKISATILGTSSVVAALTGAGALVATINGTSVVTADLLELGSLSANIFGTSSVTGVLAGGGSLAAVIHGNSVVTAFIFVPMPGVLSANIFGTSSVFANIPTLGVFPLVSIPYSPSTTAGILLSECLVMARGAMKLTTNPAVLGSLHLAGAMIFNTYRLLLQQNQSNSSAGRTKAINNAVIYIGNLNTAVKQITPTESNALSVSNMQASVASALGWIEVVATQPNI